MLLGGLGVPLVPPALPSAAGGLTGGEESGAYGEHVCPLISFAGFIIKERS